MGGRVPIGYKLKNKKLIPDDANIPNITTIFEKYIELKSVFNLKKYLDEKNIKSKTGNYFSRGNLYKILSNRIYVGMVHHKGQYYEGEQEKIIDEETFRKVQELISKNNKNNKSKHSSGSPSLLVGRLFDDKGNRMTPSHSNARGKRYRYYMTTHETSKKSESPTKIPSGEIENFVRKEVSKFLTDKDKIQEYISELNVHKQKSILSKLQILKLENSFIRSIVAKVNLFKDKVDIVLCRNNLLAALESLLSENTFIAEPKTEPDMPIKITTNIRISTTSRKGSVLVVCNCQEKEVNINPFLVKIIVKSYYWNKLIAEGKAKDNRDIQKLEKLSDNNYIKRALSLRILSPRIVEAILKGHQPTDLTVQKLLKVKTLDWQEQEKQLNFV